ncbi:hypothetical protein [Halalkalibacterium ligniniphilum]|uniref:hypothetical protein n=1 Tax=Halalkalibacterium ligniniphilum TaxID=1134413 RepID=UPI0003454403|nr:hypothetical protein [Halalkalibacterium ligniniphilum]
MERDDDKISVRLNGKVQKIREIPTKKREFFQKKTDKPWDELLPKPDNLIEFSKHQEERKRNEQPFWDDGNREQSPKLPFKRKKKKKSTDFSYSLKNVPVLFIVAVVSAIVVGVSFGFTMLTVFTGNEPDIVSSAEATNIPHFEEKNTRLPHLTVEVVQGGAFSTLEKGQQVADSIKEKSLAAVLFSQTEPIYLFMGIAQDRANSKAIGQIYEQKGQETYLKSYTVSPATIQEQAVETTTSQWFTQMEEIYKRMIDLSVDGITGSGAQVSRESVEEIRLQTLTLHEQETKAFERLHPSAQQHATALSEEMLNAGNHLAAYQQQGDEMYLLEAQQALLEVLAHYESFIQAVSS